MNDDLYKFMMELLKTPSPSGFEEKVQLLFIDFVRNYIDDIKIDVNGNVIAHKKGNGKQRIMLISHADEIGLMVKYIDNNGFIYFSEIGAVDTNILQGLQVEILNKKKTIKGIIGKKPVHLQSDEDNKGNIKVENLWIDIGATNKAEALESVRIGDYITFISNTNIFPNKLLSSKSVDNKIGLSVIAGVAQQLSSTIINCDLYIVSSVQEEIGLRGATTVTFDLSPNVGIAVDVTHATDYPTISMERNGDIRLNNGVVIPVGANISANINEMFIQISEERKIKYQLEAIPNATGTDANAIQVSKSGVATGLLSIPCRYMHTPNGIVSLEDVLSAIDLLVEFCKSVSEETSFIPYKIQCK
jgi:tetrahedral aminopeptidase